MEPELHVCQLPEDPTETGFVNSVELGRPRKINETLMPPYLEEDQSRSYFFCSLQITPFPRLGWTGHHT